MKEKIRCAWCEDNDLYRAYHDNEWGVPVHNDKVHFEFLVLESAQAGLSWLTILKRREHYRRLYADFDVKKVSEYDPSRVEMMLSDSGIIRNRKKIESSISNARNFLKIVEEYGSFDSYLWGFSGNKPIKNDWKSLKEVPPNTALSDKISTDLKSRGFKFLGSTIIYAHMQSVGIINDHLVDCFRYNEV